MTASTVKPKIVVDKHLVKVRGRTYEADTVAQDMPDALIGRGPVAIMGDLALRDGIGRRICLTLALGALHRIATRR